ncbi:hypothetical protein CR513_39613, partial [Mucuna pruriens]
MESNRIRFKPKAKATINNQDTRCHHSNSSSKKCNHQVTRHRWRIWCSMEKHCHSQHRNSRRDELKPTLNWMLTHEVLCKKKLSHYHFQLELSQQESLNLMKNC